MQARSALAIALLMVAGLGLAGCATKAPPPPIVPDDGLQATATTGLIRGVVVDQAIRPLANATVVLVGTPPREARSAADGSFGFDKLPAGGYLLKVSKSGYLAAQQTAEVVAGVATPDAVKVQLIVDPQFRAFVESYVYDGFIECTTSVLVLCGAPNAEEPLLCAEFQLCYGQVTNDRFTFTQYFQANMTMLQSELVWETNQPFSPELSFTQESINPDPSCPPIALDTAPMNGTVGPSPIYTRVHEDMLRQWDVGPTCGVYYSVFSGDATGDPSGQGVAVGATVEQRFTFFIHAFYGFMPPADWRFSQDSQVPQPPQ